MKAVCLLVSIQVILVSGRYGGYSSTKGYQSGDDGEKASEGQFPFQVSIQVSGKHRCSGVILNRRWVLTVSNCVESKDLHRTQIVAGIADLKDKKNAQYFWIAKLVEYQNMKNLPKLDVYADAVALLKLTKDIVFNSKIQDISLVVHDPQSPEETLLLISWVSDFKESPRPHISLKYYQLRSIPHEMCEKIWYPHEFLIKKKHMCTVSDSPQNSGKGNVGDILISAKSKRLVGIIPWDRPITSAVQSDVFANIYWYTNWIMDHML